MHLDDRMFWYLQVSRLNDVTQVVYGTGENSYNLI